eukprot:8819667-Pyramimonas_sp.AAC.1
MDLSGKGIRAIFCKLTLSSSSLNMLVRAITSALKSLRNIGGSRSYRPGLFHELTPAILKSARTSMQCCLDKL